MMLSQRLLHQFVAVAEELHFGRAALRLHIAQPALSRAIQRLEAYVGVALLERNQRRVTLTPAGRMFLEQTYQTLEQSTLSVERARSVAHGTSGHLSIGFIGSAGYGFVPTIIEAFRQRFPNVELTLTEMSTLEQLGHLESRRIDVGILRTPLPKQHHVLNLRHYASDGLVVALHADHPLASHRRLQLQELANESFVAFAPEKVPASYAQLMAACLAAGFLPRVTQQCSQVAVIVGLVAADMGVAIVPADLQSLQHPKVRYVPLQSNSSPLNVEVSFAWRKDSTNPTLSSFLHK